MNVYSVVVDGDVYNFEHEDSYMRFVDEMRKLDVHIDLHVGNIHNSYNEGIAAFNRNQAWKLSDEYQSYLKQYSY